MFNWFKKDKPQAAKQLTLRDTLFGDLPASEWPREDNASAEPWAAFVRARNAVNAGNTNAAIAELQNIAHLPNLESRHYLQAWHFLRQLKVNPPADKAKIVYGVVVEVGMPKGVDIVAAYADGTARYLNFSGAGEIWERPNDSLDAEIRALLEAGQAVANMIGPWDKERPDAPTNGNVRLNMLTPSGLHFGYGGFETLSKDPKGAALINPATQLMLKLTQLRKK